MGRALRFVVGVLLFGFLVYQLFQPTSDEGVLWPVIRGPIAIYVILRMFDATLKTSLVAALAIGMASAISMRLNHLTWSLLSPLTLSLFQVFVALLGFSHIIAAFKGYGGCEGTAILNLLRGREEERPCPALWDHIDRWENSRRKESH